MTTRPFIAKNGLEINGAFTKNVGTVTSNDLDLSTGDYFNLTLSGATTITFSNPAASGKTSRFVLEVTGASGATASYPAAVTWPGGSAPAAPGIGEVDIIEFETRDGGTTYYAVQVIDNAS